MLSPNDVADYLDKQSDFDLELFVYRTLIDSGIDASHAGFYADPITGVRRQFDIRATRVFNRWCEVKFSIECKALAEERPLLVSRVPRPERDSHHEIIYSWGNVKGSESSTTSLRHNTQMLLYRPGASVGKKTEQIMQETGKPVVKIRDNETFQKWSQALSSAHDLITGCYGANLRHNQDHFYVLVLPVLVVPDRTLWVADYTEQLKRHGQPSQVDEATLWVDHEYSYGSGGQRYWITHLHIYTRTGFQKFIERVLPSDEFLERAFGFAIRETSG